MRKALNHRDYFAICHKAAICFGDAKGREGRIAVIGFQKTLRTQLMAALRDRTAAMACNVQGRLWAVLIEA
ncbi:hypothetical protein SAMN04488030_1317 [Aliiroseovarius halocynthiae]|nr:hypothetical protein SAMN04488030_1317 [Aliiroseovarius halocynthiae]